jgi:hypothetical protein
VVAFLNENNPDAGYLPWKKSPRFHLHIAAIQEALANPVKVNPDRIIQNEKLCSQLSSYIKRHVGFRSKRD